MHEELAELQQAIAPGDSSASEADILAEVGDLLFAVVNFCRKQSLSPEQALRLANRKFTRRVESVQAELEKLYEGQAEEQAEGQKPTAAQLDVLWEQAKSIEKRG